MAEQPDIEGEAFAADLRDGVLWILWRSSMRVSDDDAAALVRRANALCGDRRPPMLVVLNGMVTLSRGALDSFANALKISAMALVGPSVVDRTLAGYFTEVHNPAYPTRYYENADEALEWLAAQPHRS